MVGQSGYNLTCGVTNSGAENPTITYQWTKNNGTHTPVQVGTDRVLSFSPLRLSDAGRYTCQATAVSSPCSITKMDTHCVTLQSEFSYTIMLNITLMLVQVLCIADDHEHEQN